MTLVGGIRARVVADSLYRMLGDSLAALGWFDAGRRHRPLTLIAEQIPADQEIALNTMAIAPNDTVGEEAEMGSNLSEDTWTFYIDFYAEDDSVGRHVIYDVRDILRGKFPSIGRDRPILNVYDFRSATPTVQFVCDLDRVSVDQSHIFAKPWQRHWFVVRVDVVDVYGDEGD